MFASENRNYWSFEKELLENWRLNGSVESRDASFCYLFISNIVLMIIVLDYMFEVVEVGL